MLPTKRGVGCPPHFPALRAADSCRAKRSSPGGRLNSLRKIRLLSPAVQRSKAGNDHCDGHKIPRPGAAEHRVNGVGERRARWPPGYSVGVAYLAGGHRTLFHAQVAEQGNRDAAADRGDGASPLMFHGVKLALEM